MGWSRRYSLISYLKSSLWVAPTLAVAAALILTRVVLRVQAWLLQHGLPVSPWTLDQEQARGLLERVFSLNEACLVFAFGSLLVAIQVAGGQYTPRIIATTLLRDQPIRWLVGLFVFAMLWANRILLHIGTEQGVPQLPVFLAAVVGLGALVAFIVLIDHAARLLRPVSLMSSVGRQGIEVIGSFYPTPAGETPEHPLTAPRNMRRARPAPARVVCYKGRSAVVLAVNMPALVEQARRADCVIEFAAQVGDFLGTGEPLFYIHGRADRIDEKRLGELVATGSERTMEQDPMFAFRIVVDIALKALSPAINDPTTAVLAIDQLQRLLGMVGKRSLRDHEIKDSAGQLRLILRTPDWQDFVHMSFREIRAYGADSLQVERRLRAMVDSLLVTLPAHRHAALQVELELLEMTVRRKHALSADTALARVPDWQGLGGASGDLEQDGAQRSP